MPAHPSPDRARLVVDLDLTAESVSGRVIDEQGSTTDFFGWLELMDGVEGARQRAATGSRSPRADSDGEPPP